MIPHPYTETEARAQKENGKYFQSLVRQMTDDDWTALLETHEETPTLKLMKEFHDRYSDCESTDDDYKKQALHYLWHWHCVLELIGGWTHNQVQDWAKRWADDLDNIRGSWLTHEEPLHYT